MTPRSNSNVRALAAGLALLAVVMTGPAAAQPGEVLELSLEEAITRALRNNDQLRIVELADQAAAAQAHGARGAWDPVLGAEALWSESTPPVNSAFSGAPAGALAPTQESTGVTFGLHQLLPTGTQLLLRGAGGRTDSNGTFTFLAPAYDSQLGLELRQPLLRNFGTDAARLNVRVAAAGSQAARAELESTLRDTIAAVEGTYWSVAAALRNVEVQSEAVALAEEQLEQTEVRIQIGDAPETEIAQPRAELERRRGDLLQAQEAAARAENLLKLQILAEADGELWNRRLQPTDDPPVEETAVDVAAALEQALASRPELAAADAVVAQRQAQQDYARSQRLPALDLVLSHDRFGLAGTIASDGSPIPGLPGEVPVDLAGDFGDSWSRLREGDFDDTRVGLVLEIPLGNRSARAQATAATLAREQAEAQRSLARKSVRAEVLDAAASVDTARARVEAAQAAATAAATQLEAEQERFAVGLSTNFLVLTRQNDLAAARLSETQALTDYRRARVELARVTGTLLEDRGIRVEPQAVEASSDD